MSPREKKAAEKRVERAYYASCQGVQINVMDIGKVFNHGVKLIAEGASDEALCSGVRAFVDTLTTGAP